MLGMRELEAILLDDRLTKATYITRLCQLLTDNEQRDVDLVAEQVRYDPFGKLQR